MSINNFKDSLAAQKANEERAAQKKSEIEQRSGGLESFRNDLLVEAIVTDSEHANLAAQAAGAGLPGSNYRGQNNPILKSVKAKLQQWYGLYKNCFPIPGERESLPGFTDILTKGNFDPDMQAKVGPYREFVLALRDPKTGQPVGGLNFAIYAHADGPPTMHSTYAFLAPEYRGLGLAAKLFDIRDQVALDYLSKTNPTALAQHGFYTFSEQNVPELMDGLSYVKDSSQAVDQVKRLRIWTKLGYSTIDPADFRYVQPALEAGGEACDVLSLNIYRREAKQNQDGTFSLGALQRPAEINPQTLRNHLRAFFLQSVCKDKDADVNDATTQQALGSLQSMIERGQMVKTVPAEERQTYLANWGNRVGAIAEILGARRLNGTITIQELYDQYQPRVESIIARGANDHPSPPGTPPSTALLPKKGFG